MPLKPRLSLINTMGTLHTGNRAAEETVSLGPKKVQEDLPFNEVIVTTKFN